MKLIIFLFLFTSFGVIASSQSTEGKKKTTIIEHEAYQSIYKREYRVFNDILNQIFFDTDCKTNLYIESLKKEGLFRKGKFIGHFDYKCFGSSIKDINIFFDVYPYDEESISLIEITNKDGSKTSRSVCWGHGDDFISCDRFFRNEEIKFNFK